MKKILFVFPILFLLSGCLQTRNESSRQSQVYRKKNADSQAAQAAEAESVPRVDERDELIRALNGRIETLEGQLTQLQREKSQQQQASNAESQKIAALQESLTKMEAQIQKLESESTRSTPPAAKSSDEETLKNTNVRPSSGAQASAARAGNTVSTAAAHTGSTTKTPFEIGEELFKQKEWKKAILSYQKHVEEYPKGKSVPEAKYKTGVSFQELGLKDEAIAFYEEVISQYPKTEAGKKAKIRLTGLQSKNKQKK